MALVSREPIIHEHYNTDSASGTGFVVGVIILAIVAFLLFYYGLPVLRNSTNTPQINVPGKIDVNLNQGYSK